jgi:hypothetical protein
MTKPMIRIHNIETDEVIDREMTAAEFKQYEADQKTQATREIEAEAKAQAKAELLERLGITADEAKLLLA